MNSACRIRTINLQHELGDSTDVERVPRYVLGQISACSYKLLGRVLNSCCGMQWLLSSHALVRVHHKGARELKMRSE